MKTQPAKSIKLVPLKQGERIPKQSFVRRLNGVINQASGFCAGEIYYRVGYLPHYRVA